MTSQSKCANPACSCIPEGGKKYCSEMCADSKGVTEITCQCQHSACQSAALKP